MRFRSFFSDQCKRSLEYNVLWREQNKPHVLSTDRLLEVILKEIYIHKKNLLPGTADKIKAYEC